MTEFQGTPALIQYACERCKTRLVLPPSRRRLGLAGKLRAFSMGAGRTIRLHEGFWAGYDLARRQLIARMDDQAYQSFVQSFHFCHDCRQFVCDECWSSAYRRCLTCVAKAMPGAVRPLPPFVPIGPEIPRSVVVAALSPRGRLRRDFTTLALALGVVILTIEGGLLLATASSGPIASPLLAYGPTSSGPAPAPLPHQVKTSTPVPFASAGESPSAGSSAGLIEVAGATMTAASGPTRAPNSTSPVTPGATPT
ncbi:MAG: hypothetical protein ACHQ01_06650, partial [Candidatus Limnocylindrales bacterium]